MTTTRLLAGRDPRTGVYDSGPDEGPTRAEADRDAATDASHPFDGCTWCTALRVAFHG